MIIFIYVLIILKKIYWNLLFGNFLKNKNKQKTNFFWIFLILFFILFIFNSFFYVLSIPMSLQIFNQASAIPSPYFTLLFLSLWLSVLFLGPLINNKNFVPLCWLNLMLWLLSLPSLLPIPYLFHTKPSLILPRPFFKLDIELVCYCLFKKPQKTTSTFCNDPAF